MADDTPLSKGIAWVVASFTLVTGLLGVLGGSPGSLIDRLMRHSPGTVFIGFTLCILAIGFALAAYLTSGELAKLLVGIGGILLLGGLFTLLSTATLKPIAPERATVRANLKTESGFSLEGSAKVAGLRSDQDLLVYVWGQALVRDKSTGEPKYIRELVYTSQTGPDRGGLAELSFQVPLTSGRYRTIGIAASIDEEPQACDPRIIQEVPTSGQRAARNPLGCLLVRVPELPRRPAVFATLSSGTDGGKTLRAEIEAHGLRPSDKVTVLVRGFRAAATSGTTLYSSTIGPKRDGTAQGSVELTIDAQFMFVCVESVTHPYVAPAIPQEGPRTEIGRCPARRSPRTGWVLVPLHAEEIRRSE